MSAKTVFGMAKVPSRSPLANKATNRVMMYPPSTRCNAFAGEVNQRGTVRYTAVTRSFHPMRECEELEQMKMILRLFTVLVLFVTPATTFGSGLQLTMCGNRPNTAGKTCLVDGDTLWLDGENIRLKNFDTPEPQSAICGGRAEVELAREASARMLELLNGNDWTIERFGFDETSSKRRLATIRIDGQDVGDILIAERLARRWPDGDEFWCR
jgi:endonuclease YncB( thermonuclease family)